MGKSLKKNELSLLLDSKTLELEKVKERYTDLKRKYTRMNKKMVIWDEMLGEFKSQITKVPQVSTKRFYIPDEEAKKWSEHTVLPIGDIHYNEVIDPEELEWMNAYNTEIAEYRMERLIKGVKNLTNNVMTNYTFKSINVLFLGDLLSGSIHDELTITNEYPEIEAVLMCEKMLSEFILELRTIFPKVNVYGIAGNHGRLTKDKRYKKGWNGWDYLTMKMMEARLGSYDGIKFDIPKSVGQRIEIGNHTVYITHGDAVRMHYSIPWYGLTNFIKNRQNTLAGDSNKPITEVFMGHFHQAGTIPVNRINAFIVASIVGTSEYSLKSFSTAPNPETIFMGFADDQKKPKISWIWPMNRISDERERKELW